MLLPKKVLMTSQIEKYLTIGFCTLWAILIFTDYWYYHPEYGQAIQVFQYLDLGVALAILGGITGFGIYKFRDWQKPIFFINGLGILALFLLISGLIIYFHFNKIGENFTVSFGEILTYLGKVISLLVSIYFIFLTAFSVGDLVFKYFFSFSWKRSESILVKIALGVTVTSLVLFLLGTINALNIMLILPLFLLILGVNWKSNWRFIQTTLLNPGKAVKQLNWLGFSSVYLLLIFLSLIFLQNIRPFPFGFDALALYLNLPNLIGQSEGLVAGYSPYYWSLFVSLGYIIFDHIIVVIGLSVSAGILCVFFIYEICRKWLDVNTSLLTASLLYSLPMVNFQSYRDVKTDLGLLFILLAVVLVLIKWLSIEDESAYKYKTNAIIPPKQRQKSSKTKRKKEPMVLVKEEEYDGILGKYLSENTQLIILIGILSGMAIGIKLTGLIIIFSILSVFAYIKGGHIGFLTAFVFSFAIILLGGLEVATGLRAYHFGAGHLKIVFPIIGLVGLGYLFVKRRKELFDLVRIAAVYGGVTILFYLPWPIKNYQETKVLSINTFIIGKSSNRVMDVNTIIRNAKEIETQQKATATPQ